MKILFSTFGVPLCAGLSLLLGACSAPDQYFRLSADGPAILPAIGAKVLVGPVTLSTYVDRAELVFQSADNQFQVPANVRWTGALQENFTRVLATDLGRRLGSGNVLTYPAPPTWKARVQVVVDVHQFHAISGGDAILEVSWRVQSPETGQMIHRQNGSFRERVIGDGYAPVVAAESRLVAQLAEAVGRGL